MWLSNGRDEFRMEKKTPAFQFQVFLFGPHCLERGGLGNARSMLEEVRLHGQELFGGMKEDMDKDLWRRGFG